MSTTETTTGPAVVIDATGLSCPVCGSRDIVEIDRCERSNTIHYDPATGSVSIAQSDAEFETVGLGCRSCESGLTEPDGFFDRAEWY